MTTFRMAYDGFLLSQKARNVSKAYIDLLELTRDYWLRLNPDGELEGISADVVREWITWLQGERLVEGAPAPSNGLSSASVCIHFRDLRAFWNWAVKEELLAASPMRKLKRPRVEEKLPDVLTEEEVRILLKRVRESGNPNAWRDYCVHLMLIDTGIRLEELSRLDIDDINLQQGYAKVFGKGRKERGGVRTMVVRDQKDYVERTLSKYGPHMERHTSATIRLRSTGDVERTRQILGHTSLETTQRYLHLINRDLLGDTSPMDAVMAERSGNSLRNSKPVEAAG